MFNRLNYHLQVNNVLIPEQFDFRNGSTINNAGFTLTNYILTTPNERKQIAGIFCDWTKMFV
jgi:hypothetical protein